MNTLYKTNIPANQPNDIDQPTEDGHEGWKGSIAFNKDPDSW